MYSSGRSVVYRNSLKRNSITGTTRRKSNPLKSVVFFFILFPYIRQRTMDELPHLIQMTYSVWLIISASVIYLIAISLRKNVRLYRELSLFLIFWIIYIATTIINVPTSLMYVLRKAYCFFAIVLFVFIFSDDLDVILSVLAFIYGSFIVLELLTDVMFPNGLYQTYTYHTAHLLGDDNAIINVTQPGIALMLAAENRKGVKVPWLPVLLEILLIISFGKMEAASSLVASFVFVLLMFYIYTVGKPNGLLFMGVVVIMIVVCLFGLSNQNIQRIITDIFHKSLTLSGRTIIWQQALDYIKASPIFGYGGYYQFGRFWFNMSHAYSCHTPYLQILIDGGIVLFVTLLIIVYTAFRQIDKCNDRMLSILACGLVAMMVNYITEQTELYHLFIIVAIMIVYARNLKTNNVIRENWVN